MFTDGMSRLAVAVSVTVALSLAIFVTILVLLLADLICAHLRRRRLRAEASRSKLGLALATTSPEHGADDAASSVATTATTAAREALAGTPPFYYAHGVLHAPSSTKDLLLAIPRLEGAVWRWSPARRSSPSSGSSGSGSSARGDGFMCISNPVYDRGQVAAAAAAAAAVGDTPPFDTPGASPSPSPFGITEEADAYDEEDGGGFSPPLSAMRKLPPLGVLAAYPPPALSFADARPSLATTVTDTNRASSTSSAYFFSSWSSK
ncbi:unnamed protein product [Miscanthus lutarioriparius]|uniref:Uncharacterized protein n=1 Tax=Miscanthus lutarioriparius TaxID=422564 RepID=A0A811QLZ5_9POAL|nr:unnamed protein product [Miscanthus lutarioriparius]